MRFFALAALILFSGVAFSQGYPAKPIRIVVGYPPGGDEAGVPGFESTFWFGLYAPAGTPMEIVRRLHAAAKVE